MNIFKTAANVPFLCYWEGPTSLPNLMITMLEMPSEDTVKKNLRFLQHCHVDPWIQSSQVANTGFYLFQGVPNVQGRVEQGLLWKEKRRNFYEVLIIGQKRGAFKCKLWLCLNTQRHIESGDSPNESGMKLQPILGIWETFVNFIQIQTSYFRVMLPFRGHMSVSGDLLVVTTREETGQSCTGQRVRELPFS